jgi:hypothetical protein
MILEFLYQEDAFYVTLIIVGDILPPLAGFRQDAFADIIMNGFFGNPGALN